MKRLLSLILVIIMSVTVLCACNDEYKIKFEKLPEETSEAVSDDNSASVQKKLLISAERPSESFLTSTKNYHLYKADGENHVTLLYKAKETLTNLEIFKIAYSESGEAEKGEILFTLEILSTSKHLVASTLYGEEKSGICFYDTEGHFYAYEIDPIGPDSTAKIKLNEIDIGVLESEDSASE